MPIPAALSFLALVASLSQEPGPSDAPLTATTPAAALTVLPRFERLDMRAWPQPVDLLVRLRGRGEPPGERPPLDLAIVLDRSSSMQGERFEAVRAAAKDLVTALGPRDRISVVSYSDDVAVHTRRIGADVTGASRARGEIDVLQSFGGTALGPGLIKGLELLELARRAPREQAHVLLLSDGHATTGETDPDALAARAAQGFGVGVGVSTLGVGLNYNEDLMTRIADHGGGRYHFIERAEDVARVVAEEFAGLAATSATGIALDFAPAPDVSVTHVHGYAAREHAGQTRVSIGTLAADQTRDIMVRLSVAAGAGDRVPLGVLTMTATDLTTGKRDRTTLALALRTTRDPAELAASENSGTTRRLLAITIAEAIDRAVALARSDRAAALALLDEQQRRLDAAPADPSLAALKADIEEARADIKSLGTKKAPPTQRLIKKYKSKAYKIHKK